MPRTSVAVIGSIVKDTVYPYEGEPFQSLGGIYYTLAMMASVFPANWDIFPVCYVGTDAHDQLIESLSQHANIHTDGICRLERPTSHVALRYRDRENRDEQLTDLMPPFKLKDIVAFADCDVLVANFITGYEMDLEVYRRLASARRGLLYVDYHSLSLGRDHQGGRYLARRPDWREWVRPVDILQMNELEAATLSGENADCTDRLAAFASELVADGLTAFNLTRASRGSTVVYKAGNTAHPVVRRMAPHTVEAVDATGCGDSFAVGFLARFLESGDPVAAARFANLVAGLNCTFSGTDNLGDMRGLIAAAERE